MNEPKFMFFDSHLDGSISNTASSKKLKPQEKKYTSVNKLKEWIEENETELRELYELRKYLEE